MHPIASKHILHLGTCTSQTASASLRFNFAWYPDLDPSCRRSASIETDLGKYTIIVIKAGDNYTILITPKPPFARRYKVMVPGNECLTFRNLDPNVPTPNDHLILATVPQKKLKRTGVRYEVEVHFTNQNIHKTPKLPPGEIMMQKFYNDEMRHDVCFTFDNACSTKPGSPVDNKIVAHKLILEQWPYFADMLDREKHTRISVNQHSDIHTIPISEIRKQVFEQLKQFMYTRNLKQNPPNPVFSDGTQTQDSVAVEEVYMAAVFFELHELVQMLHAVLVLHLTPRSALAFMIRRACHYPDLQREVVKYVATFCG
ncbi:hypothetical protein BGZ74_002409 [Mortierella antarctica]|nr:hypothetical protein BGZ74_002409 [Mortierella antarctica]